MREKKKIKITRHREVHTYCELWWTAHSMLMQGRSEEDTSHSQFMGSLVFTAFSLEAFLNHIGPKLFQCWSDLERLGPKEKLNVLAEKLGVTVDYGKRPWQIIKNLFEFRNDLAHGKSIKVLEENVVTLSRYNHRSIVLARTRWEKFCTHENAERAREDVEKIVHTLSEASGLEEHPFIGGWQETDATLEEK